MLNKTRNDLTQARLKHLMLYDPDTGEFPRRVRCGSSLAGTRAWSMNSTGYLRVTIDGWSYLLHRLAFLYVTGAFPPEEVDHKDGDPTNNKWSNLRPATRAQNQANTGLLRNNKSGFRGVHWAARDMKWLAFGKKNGRRTHIGYFDTAEEADSAARAWRAEHFGEFASR